MKIAAMIVIISVLTGCSGHVKLGYMLEADGKAEWRPQEEE